METTEKINWKNDQDINQSITEFSSDLSSVYSRVSGIEPDETLKTKWEQGAKQWFTYNRNIVNLYFATKAEGEAEVERILAEFKKMDIYENQLINKSK